MAATRILVIVSSRSPYWTQALESAEVMGGIALDILKQNSLLSCSTTPRFVAEEKFTTRTHLIFDVFYDDYRPETAHLPGQGDLLPVLQVWLSKEPRAGIANPKIQDMVNERVREIHDLMGMGSVPPFSVDHSNGQVPTFWHPRTLRRAPNPSSSEQGMVEGEPSLT